MASLSYRAALVSVSSMLTAACGSIVDAQHGDSTGSGGSTSTTSTTTTTTATTGEGGAPASGPDQYQAWNLFTNVARYAILKASAERNLCFRIIVVTGSGTGLSGLTGNVSVESALVTHDVTDCTIGSPPLPMPAGPTYPAVSGMGTVDMATMLPAGCTTTIAAKLVFSPGAPWVPPSELFEQSQLQIMGGCP